MIIPQLVRRTLWTRHSLVSSRACLANPLRLLFTQTPDEVESFGSYSVILPEEPFIWGVSHITPRLVPPNIRRPPYARTLAGGWATSSSSESGCLPPHEDRIRLGSEQETKLRAAAKLARKVREFAGTLVRVGMILKLWFMDDKLMACLL